MREYVQEVAQHIEESVQHVMVDEEGCEKEVEAQAVMTVTDGAT
jgi:hypothetical protein